MTQDQAELSGPDLARGIALSELADGAMLLGHAGGEQVLLVRQGAEVFAVGHQCTHYHGPLADGLASDGTVRCPWHHACFDLRSGEALRTPALDPIDCWTVIERDGKILVGEKRARTATPGKGTSKTPERIVPDRIVIVGGGAAGFAGAERLRRGQFQGR